MYKKAFLMLLYAVISCPVSAIDFSSEEVFNVCFFAPNGAEKLKKYSSYREYDIDGSYITLDDDFWAAARRVMVDLEAFSLVPLVIFGVDASKLDHDIALISSEPGVEPENIIPGLTATILFDNDFIKRLNSKYSPNSYDAFMVVLMHEVGHFRMMRYIPHRDYKKIPTVLKELHADFLAGWFSAYIQKTHYDGNRNLRSVGLKVFSDFGDLDKGAQLSHGNPEQRSAAFAFGWEVYSAQGKLDGLDVILGRPGVSNIAKLAAAERLVMTKLFSNYQIDADELVGRHFFGPDSISGKNDDISLIVNYGAIFEVDMASIQKRIDLKPFFMAVQSNSPTQK